MKEQASQGFPQSGAAGAGTSSGVGKKSMHFTEPAVEKFEENYYMIAYDVFNLGKPGSPLESPLRKMTADEIEQLPVIISWKGPKLNFETDFEQCVTHIAEVLFDFNLMQPRNCKYVSFGLGNGHISLSF